MVVEAHALEVLDRDELEEQSPWQGKEAKCDANEVLLNAELSTLGEGASVLNHGQLHDHGEDDDAEEHAIAEESFEDVQFSFLDLSGVDLVEHLEHHEDLEHKGEVQKLLAADHRVNL